jgi:FtsP/CotA-like multicopper oxidase with cupredoxin domain
MPRRTFVKGLAVGGAAAGLGLWRASAFAQGNTSSRWSDLSGTEFDLRIGETPMNFTGRPRTAITINGLDSCADTALERGRHGHTPRR